MPIGLRDTHYSRCRSDAGVPSGSWQALAGPAADRGRGSKLTPLGLSTAASIAARDALVAVATVME